MLFWPLLLIGMVYGVARELFGPVGGFVSLVLCTFSPLILGHGHLVTTDVPVATMMLPVAVGFWRLDQKSSVSKAMVAGALLGGALTVKFSAVIILPAVCWFWIIRGIQRYIAARKAISPEHPVSGQILWQSALRWTGYLVLAGTISLFVIWAVSGFRYRASGDAGFVFRGRFDGPGTSLIGHCLEFARAYQLLPEAFIHGFGFMYVHAPGRI